VVEVDGQRIKEKRFTPVIIAYNKPKGIVCTTEKMKGNIIEAVGHKEKVYPVGRLDKESEGLILLTNVGALIDKIANPEFEHEKEYQVTLNMPIRSAFLKEINEGINLNGEMTLPCKTQIVPGTKRLFRIILKQGMNRQIRRMCNAYDYQVLKLVRLRIMNIELGDLKAGEWRDLTEIEKAGLLSNLNIEVIN
jgi:23S rRNA pseudouridine2604 synthase